MEKTPPLYARIIGQRKPIGLGIYDADGNLLAEYRKREPWDGHIHRWNGGGNYLPDTVRKVPGFTTGRLTVPGSKATTADSRTVLWPLTPAEKRAVAAYIKTGEIIERLPLEMIEPGEIAYDETKDMLVNALNACNAMICYATQAELKRHGLI